MTRHVGRFVWFELVTSEIARAASFYTEVFGWRAEPIATPAMQYTLLERGGDSLGGILAPPVEGLPSHWKGYVSVDDVDATAKAIAAAGGRALSPAYDVEGYGRIQTVADPHGGTFGLWRGQTGDSPAATGEHGWHWSELWTVDPSAEADFYTRALGYHALANPMPMGSGDYFVLTNDQVWCAGIMSVPAPGIPPMWLHYVHVPDCDATVRRIVDHGGSMLAEPMDMPGTGRFAVAADPTGATFGVITPAQ